MIRSGVYQIRNIINDHRYIGSTVDLAARFTDHKSALRRCCHRNKHLQHAWDKYGKTNFVFEPLLYCDPENLILYEQICLDNLSADYNIRTTAESNAGLEFTEEHKKKIGLANKGHRGYNKGGRISEETRQRMSISKIGNAGRLGIPHTEETKRKMSINRKGKGLGPQTAERIKKRAESNRGHKHTEASKQIMRDHHSGGTPGPLSEEHKRKISISLKEYFAKKVKK